MFDRLGRLAVARPWAICAAWIALALGLSAVAPSWQDQAQDDDVRFLPASCPSVRGYQTLERAFPQDVFASRAVLAIERADGRLTPTDFKAVDRIVAALNELRRAEPDLQIVGIASHRDPLIGSRLVSADAQSVLVQVSLGTPYLAIQTRIAVDRCEEAARAALQAANGGSLSLHTTGPAGVGRDIIRASADSLEDTTWATIVLILVVLLVVYRSPVLALIPLVTIGVSSWVAIKLLALASLLPGVQLVNVSQVFAIVILFGAGTDYCLFLISRYREALDNGEAGPASLHRSVRSVGGALAASAGTVICGLGMMGFAEFTKIRCAGPVIALALAVGLAASLTLTPALLRLTGRAVFWPVRLNADRPRFGAVLWERISHWVVRRPGWVLGGSLALLAPFVCAGLFVTPSFSPIGDLSPNAGSVRGLNVIRRHFTPGEVGPIAVLLGSDTNWTSPAGRELIAHLSRGFVRLDNVAEVRSLTQPLGEPVLAPTGITGLLARTLQSAATNLYVADCPDGNGPRFVTRLDVVLRSDPFDPSSVATLDLIETWLRDFLPARAEPIGGVQSDCFGITVSLRDMAAVIERDRARINGLVLAGVFLILLVLVKKVWLAAYLLATVLLSYLATLGLTAGFAALWSGTPFGPIEWRVPFFLFTILVAVGEDYNILMVTRALREAKRHGPVEGIRRGLARTGGTITACGVIMAGTFATLMLGGLGTLVQIGFALGIGVLLDTLLVRPFLVPAFMLLVMGRDEEEPITTLPFPLARRAG